MLLRTIVASLCALLLAAQAARTALVEAEASSDPAKAAKVWPGHPDVARSLALARIGAAAAAGAAAPSSAIAMMDGVAARDPLAIQPLLVAGANAQNAGDRDRAERLFAEARRRDPRSAAARFLLADLYLRGGRVVEGLGEMSVLGRIVPGGGGQLAPALAAYASTPGAVPKLREIFAARPELETPVLLELAADSGNRELILAIASRHALESESAGRWQAQLLDSLVEDGAFGEAYAAWTRFAGLPPATEPGLFNPGFRPLDAPPPFNWRLTSRGGGLAEPADGSLRVLFYGRENETLASQLLLLPPGAYELSLRVSGKVGNDSVRWIVTCLPGGTAVLDLALKAPAAEPLAGRFEVPGSGCRAQRLALVGRGQEFAESADFQIGGLRLARVGRP